MLNKLLPLLTGLECEKLQVNITKGESPEFARASLFIGNALFANANKKGITLAKLAVDVYNLKIQEKQPFDPAVSHITVNGLFITISAQWLNDTLDAEKSIYEESGLKDVAVVCLPPKEGKPGKLLIRGSLKKGLSFPFSIEIRTGIDKNNLTIELFQFNLMEILPLPQGVQNFLIDVFTEKLKQKFIDIQNHKFYIDIISALDLPLTMTLKDFRVEKDQIVLEAGNETAPAV